ncbi:MAG: hypothetical protein J6S75_04615, partial [Thermoguttaceae bacterium]|nr:hypothetical protein [Thermoguttaceae bacterium]
MSFLRLMGDLSRTKSTAKRGAPQRRRSLRFESLERRELLTAATAGDFATLKQLAEEGQDYEIELTADITVTESDTIAVAGNISIDGGSSGHTITLAEGVTTRTTSLFTVSDNSLTLSNLTINGIVYSGGKGAVINQTGGTTAINSGTVILNCAAGDGGVGYISGGSLTIGSDASDDTTIAFRANTAGNAGVFYAADSGTITVNHGTFGGDSTDDGNTCTRGGGVFYLKGGATAEVNGGTFKNNSSVDSGRGGGVFRLYEVTTASVTINDGIFDSNSTAGKGGVIFADGGTITINGGTITNNTARSTANNGGGGVIYINKADATVTINGGTFTGNSATGTTNSSGGGVIYAYLGNSVTIGGSATIISDNTANRGAVLFINKNGAKTVTINDGTFSGNSAVGSGYSGGGVICVFNNKGAATAITINGGTFTGNSSTGGSGSQSYSGGGVVSIH